MAKAWEISGFTGIDDHYEHLTAQTWSSAQRRRRRHLGRSDPQSARYWLAESINGPTR
ncbi:MAG: hypothetical protein IH820_08330 [Bacteroidetes bacterium]|nr:hypothetical protein [Bacteroidota bacterium]